MENKHKDEGVLSCYHFIPISTNEVQEQISHFHFILTPIPFHQFKLPKRIKVPNRNKKIKFNFTTQVPAFVNRKPNNL